MDDNNYVQCNNNVETCKKIPADKKNNIVVASKKNTICHTQHSGTIIRDTEHK